MDFDPAELERLRAGDVRALEACYRAFGDGVFRIARGLLGRRTDAEDAVHDVFVKIFERASQFQGTSSFATWIHRLTVNHCLNLRERSRVRRAEELCDDGERAPRDARSAPDELAAMAEERERLAGLLQELAPAHRAVLVLRELEGLSYNEIAGALDVPEGTVMSRLARAREALLQRVSAHGAKRASIRPTSTRSSR